MKVSDIEIHTGTVDFGYKAVRRLEARVEATTAFQGAPTIEEANSKLRELATKVGANAIIDTTYNSGVSLTSWRSMKATGLAVIREAEEVVCPSCAEMIKRAAVKCRFCGTDISLSDNFPNSAPSTGSTSPSSATDVDELPPLEGTNNPIIWVVVSIGVFLLFMIMTRLH